MSYYYVEYACSMDTFFTVVITNFFSKVILILECFYFLVVFCVIVIVCALVLCTSHA